MASLPPAATRPIVRRARLRAILGTRTGMGLSGRNTLFMRLTYSKVTATPTHSSSWPSAALYPGPCGLDVIDAVDALSSHVVDLGAVRAGVRFGHGGRDGFFHDT